MARGETRFGQGQQQVSGTGKPRRGGSIIDQFARVEASVPGAQAATAANYGVIFHAHTYGRPDPAAVVGDGIWEVTQVTETHETLGTDAGAVTLMLKKCTDGQAPSAGVDCLSAGFNLKGTINTRQTGSLNATQSNYQLKSGDRLALVTTGVLTAVAGVSVQVELKRIG